MNSCSHQTDSRIFERRGKTKLTHLVDLLLLILILTACLGLGACRSRLERAEDPKTSSSDLGELAASEDPAVQVAVAHNPSSPEDALEELATNGESAAKLALLERGRLPDEIFSQLRTDRDPAVRLAVVGHPELPIDQTIEVARSGNTDAKLALLSRPSLATEVMVLLAHDQSQEVRLAVAGFEDLDRLRPEQPGAGESSRQEVLTSVLRELGEDESAGIRAAVAANPLTAARTLEHLALDPELRVRTAVAANPDAPPLTLYRMLEGEDQEVRLAVAGNPHIGPKTVARLSRDSDAEVRKRIAGNPATPVPVLNSLARSDESLEVQEEARLQGSALPEVEVDLVHAQRAGLVTVLGHGRGLEDLELELKLEVVQPVRLTIEAGTVFHPGATGTQAMVLTEGTTVRLEADRPELRLTLDAACAEMHNDTPGRNDTFTLETAPTGDLAKLLNLPEFSRSDFRVRQFAVWTITDNPSRHGYVGLGTFAFGSGPSDEEMEEIRSLFRRAGIPLGKYRAFG